NVGLDRHIGQSTRCSLAENDLFAKACQETADGIDPEHEPRPALGWFSGNGGFRLVSGDSAAPMLRFAEAPGVADFLADFGPGPLAGIASDAVFGRDLQKLAGER